MRSFCTRTLALLASLYGLTGIVNAQDEGLGVPALLPVPMVQVDYSTTQVQYQPPSYQVASRYRQGEAVDPALPPVPPPLSEAAPAAHPPILAPQQDVWSGGHCDDGSCGGVAGCDTGGRLGALDCWFVSGSGLAMTRDDSNNVWLSYDLADIDSAILSSRHAEMDWAGGFEVHLGRYFNCGRNAIEGVYWGLFPADETADIWDVDTVGGLGSSLNFDTLEYDDLTGNGPGAVADWYNNAARHSVTRWNQFHNVEINLLGNPGCFSCQDTCCSSPRIQLGWLAGVRYFLFDHGFSFCTDETDYVFSGAVNELHYQVDVDNHLIGFQLGGAADFLITQRLRSFATLKFGLYGNHINHTSQVFGGAGHAYINNPGSEYDGVAYNLNSYKNDVAFLGELNLGGSFQVSERVRLIGGYRAVAVTGVALDTEQIPQYFGDVAGVRNIDSNGSLILHGAFGGLEVNY